LPRFFSNSNNNNDELTFKRK